MCSRQRSASSLSLHASSSSPGGSIGGSCPGGGGHYLHDPDPVLYAAEIPTYHGNSLSIPFGSASPYPTMSATYTPSQPPSTTTRPRAHTSADSSPSNLVGGPFGGLHSRQSSRNSMMPTNHPGGMAMRHVSTSVLDSSSRLGGPGGVGGMFSTGSPPAQNNMMSIPPPPPPNGTPAPPPKDYYPPPHYATISRSHGRDGMDPRTSVMNYHYAQQQQQQQPQLQPHHTQQYGTYTPSQLPPLSMPHHNSAPQYVPHQGTLPHHPHRPPPEVPMYRQPSAQSSESIVSFARTESTPDNEYMTPATTHSTGSGLARSHASQSAGNQNSSGITRSSHVPHSQQSPLVASSAQGPLSPDVATVWTLDRVVSYLDRHAFSVEWQEAFRKLNIYGMDFLEMGQHNSLTLHRDVLPEVMRICGPNGDLAKEKLAAKNIKKMVREILKLSRDIPSTPPSTGECSGKSSEPKSDQINSPNQMRFSNKMGSISNGYMDSAYNPSSSTEQLLTRGNNDGANQHRTTRSESANRNRSEYSKEALASIDQISKHSPSNSDTSVRGTFPYGTAVPVKGSPQDSPNPGYQSMTNRHGKSNPPEPAANSTNHRAGDGKGKEKALLVLGLTSRGDFSRQDSYENKPTSGGGKIVNKFKKRFRSKDHKEDDSVGNEEDSPTSPAWRPPNLPFAIPENNFSDSSVDRLSLSSADGRGRAHNPRSVPRAAVKNKSVLVLVTKDGKVWVLVDLTSVDEVDNVRKEICWNLGINDWDSAGIHLTEVGKPHDVETLTDQMLVLSCRTRGDNTASLKFFVQPPPMSAFETTPIGKFITRPMSASPSQQSSFSGISPLRASVKPQSQQIERTKKLNRRSSSPHLASESSTLKQSDFLEPKPSLERISESIHTSPPRIAPKDDLDDLRERLALLSSFQDNGNNGPQINVIQPTSNQQNPPSMPPAPHPSIQPSPNDSIPDPNSAYPEYGSEWSSQPTLKPIVPKPASNASPVEAGLSPALRQNELFFEEASSPAPSFTSIVTGSHGGSAGSSQLEAAAKSHRHKLEIAHQQEIVRQARDVEQQKRLKQAEHERHTGFAKVHPTWGGRLVDFDNPRSSPYDEVKMDNLIPHRNPPPVPVNRTSTGGTLLKNSEPLRHVLSAEVGRGHGVFSQMHRKKSVDKRPPEMTERREGRRKAVPPLQTVPPPSVSGIGSSLISAGMMPAGITRTPIPHIPRAAPSTAGSTPSSASQAEQQPHDPPQRPKAMASVNFDQSGGSSPRSGGTPNSPGFTWGKGNQLFKIPDYQPEVDAAGPDKLKLQIPQVSTQHISPDISPGDREVPFMARPPVFGGEIPFKENDVQFTSVGEGASEDDSDEDEGLFAIPISSRVEKPKMDFPTPKSELRDGEGTESPKPTLTIATKNVTFRSTPTTSATASASATTTHSPPTPSFESWDETMGANSPAGPNHSAPGSAAASAHSPDSSRPGLGRRDSFVRDDVWASRPPAEALINHLDEFFPNLDLDQPIIDEVVGSPPPSPSPATELKPRTYQLEDSVPAIPTVPSLPESPITSPDAGTLAPESSTAGSMGPPPAPVNKGKQTVPAVAQRSLGRSQLGRMKSIREVAKGAHEKSKRFTQPNAGDGTGAKSGDILRRKSTKLWNANLIEVKPMGKRGVMQIQQQQQQQIQQQQQQPQQNNQHGKIKRQATFKWFKGQLIGKGTYGRVYLGMNATTGEFLAVKQVEVSKNASAGDSDHQKEMIAALNQEIETMQHLDHINIVQYLGCERKEMSMSIFLEYISGGSVGSCLRKHGRFSEPVVRSLTRQTLSGLEYLHQEGILHRDLKADNILLDVDGTCKISDFGISKRSDNIYGDDPGNSMQGSVFWMAPEVIRPEGQGYSAKIDIWSLGCVVLEMFAGRRPWSKEEAIGAIYKLGSERMAPPIPDDVAEVISPSAIGFLADCHTIEPAERPTAATLLGEHEFCSHDPNFNFLDTTLYQKIRGQF